MYPAAGAAGVAGAVCATGAAVGAGLACDSGGVDAAAGAVRATVDTSTPANSSAAAMFMNVMGRNFTSASLSRSSALQHHGIRYGMAWHDSQS